jgi:hypothetical protein
MEAASKVNFIKSMPNNICLCVPISAASMVKFNHRPQRSHGDAQRFYVAKHNFVLPSHLWADKIEK